MINIHVLKDDNGLPIYAEVTDGARKLLARVEGPDTKITGSRRSFTTEMVDALKLVFPVQQKALLEIPQPLQVAQVNGGEILLFDDMEGLLKWGGVNVSLDNTMAYNGSQALKIFNEAAAASRNATREFPIKHYKKIEYSFYFGFDDYTKVDTFSVYLRTYNGTKQVYSGLRLDVDESYWFDIAGASVICNQPSALSNLDAVKGSWHYLRAVLDLNAQTLTEFQINNRTHVLSNPLYGAASANAEMSDFGIYLDNKGAVDVNCWIDDVLIREKS